MTGTRKTVTLPRTIDCEYSDYRSGVLTEIHITGIEKLATNLLVRWLQAEIKTQARSYVRHSLKQSGGRHTIDIAESLKPTKPKRKRNRI